VVLFNCGTGLKYPMPSVSGAIDRHKPVDYAAMNSG
jgi:threonine synthase